MSIFFLISAVVSSPPVLSKIMTVESLIQHADRLMDESAHNFITNHGMMQNNALLSVALAYPELDQGGKWQQTAIQRMERYLKESVAADGVFLELTPAYHLFASQAALWFVATCQNARIALDPFFESTLQKMSLFSREIQNPDRSLPLIADTGYGHIWRVTNWPWENLPNWPELNAFREAMSRTDRLPNEPTARLWPDSGYFLLRAPAPIFTTTNSRSPSSGMDNLS